MIGLRSIVMGWAVIAGGGTDLGAQYYHLRDGRVIPEVLISIRGVELVEEVEPEDAASQVERRIPITEVSRLEFPEPAALATAREAGRRGAWAETLPLLEPIRERFVLFATVPGSWWTAASIQRLEALLALGSDADAVAAAKELIATADDPTAVGTARIALAELQLRAGQVAIAEAMLTVIQRDPLPSRAERRLRLIQAEIALQRGKPEDALDGFLRIPVLHPEESDLIPLALQGAVRAYRILGDPATARRLEEEWAPTPERPSSPDGAGPAEPTARAPEASATLSS